VSIWTRQRRRSRDDKAQRRRQNRGPSLEALEDRYLLSTDFIQINLDSDVPGLARVTDPNANNPWGIAFSPTGAFWLGENGSGVSDVMDGNGQLLPVVVTIPGIEGHRGTPTGVVYNGSTGFQVTANGVSGPAHFLFASEDGTISAWNPQVDDSSAHVVIDNSAAGAVYKGLALATGADGKPYLYAADFGRGMIDVFDQDFNPVSTNGSFSDPNLPSGFAPFNVQNINGQLFVTYAKKEADGSNDVAGAGNGFIDVFSPSGSLVERLASGGALNSPWGMAVAPQSFGPFGGALLVSNNGDGRISAYDLSSGAYLGQLTDGAGNPLAIDGLWGLTFGNDHLAGNSQTLFFAAGINHEQHGLFGAIQKSQDSQSGTAGTLPYDPNSDNDDYPLPPAQGPAIGSDSGQPAPTAVLLPISNSSFALAPTLSIFSQSPESQVGFAVAQSFSPGGSRGIPNPANPVVAIGSITAPGGLTAFSSTSPLALVTWDLTATEIGRRFGGDAPWVAASVSLMLLGLYPSSDSTETVESTFPLVSSDLCQLQPKEVSPADWCLFDRPVSSPNHPRRESSVEQNLVPYVRGGQPKEASLWGLLEQQQPGYFVVPAKLEEDSSPPNTTFYDRVVRALFLGVPACLFWNHSLASEFSSRKSLSLTGRDEGEAPSRKT